MPKLYNVIIIYDMYAVAETAEAARESGLTWIKEGIQPSEVTALETRYENNIRARWVDEKPLVASDVSDVDFAKIIKGHTTLEVFKSIYTNQDRVKLESKVESKAKP